MPVRSPRKPKSPVTEQYFQLVREFPLIPITSDAQADAATDMIFRLLQESLDQGGERYVDVLSELVAQYESDQRGCEPATPADRLRELMELNGMTQMAFAARTGIKQGTVSAVLNGKRLFTSEQMLALGECFALHPGYFLGQSASLSRRSSHGSR